MSTNTQTVLVALITALAGAGAALLGSWVHAQAQIVANKELRERLHELAEDPRQLDDPNALRAFVEQIHADVRKEGEPT